MHESRIKMSSTSMKLGSERESQELTDCLWRRLVCAPELHADVGRRADDVQPDHRHSQLHRLDLGAAERGSQIWIIISW